MSDEQIRYDMLMLEAHRWVIRRVLRDTAANGLPGDHHFFIVFDTMHPGVRLSDRLRAQYPREMTIVLQHQFRNLRVMEEHFEVQLSFGGIPELLKVPFQAINGFVDPSVPFGLKLHLEPAAGLENSITMLVPGLPKEPEEIEAAAFEADAELDDETEYDADEADRQEPRIAVSRAGGSGLSLLDDIDNGEDEEDDEERPSADVVQLDAFRKKTS